jgi:CHAT domain-containing protein
MSLWEVDDKATSLFMSFFYEALTAGKKKHEAFVAAQSQLKEKYSDPYYWAAFIMLD